MSALAIILCAALFASSANASFVSSNLEKAQESLNNLIENAIKEVKSIATDAKQKSDEFWALIEERVSKHEQTISDLVASKVEQAVEDVNKLTEAIEGVDVTQCTELTNQLQHTADAAIVEMQKCFVEKRAKAAGYIGNMAKISDRVLDELNTLKSQAYACVDHVDGLLAANKALICTNVVTAKAAFTVAKAVPELSVQAAKLEILLLTLSQTLTHCTTTRTFYVFYYESSVIVAKTRECIQQKVNEVRNRA